MIKTLPFFLTVKDQNKIYKLFLKYPVHTFFDSTQKMREYGYLIYAEYKKNEQEEYLDYPSYLERLDAKIHTDDVTITFTKKRIHTFLFFMIVIILIICLYRL